MKSVSQPEQHSNLRKNNPAVSGSSGSDPKRQDRARALLGLDVIQARPLPPRVERIWRQDGFAGDIPFTNAMFVPAGTSDIGLLYEAVARVVDRHEALRTRLAVLDGRAVQIAEGWNVSRLEMTRIQRAELTDNQSIQDSAVAAFTQGRMDLYAQDGFRCHAFQDESGAVTLGVLAHGFFADAWSSQTLLREIRAVQTVLEGGTDAFLPPASQYADYARDVRATLNEGLCTHLDYWLNKLASMPPARLPRDRDDDTKRRGRSFFFLGQEISERLAACAQERRVSLMILLMAAYQLALARWSGQEEILSAAYTADRVRPQFHNTIGMLVTNMPIRSRIDPAADLGTFLLELSREYYDGYAHRELSCELYDAIFAPQAPFCATVFNFVPLQKNFSDRDMFAVPAFTGTITTPDAARPAIYREIYLGLSQHTNGILGKVFYNAGHFTPDAIEAFIAIYREVVRKILSDPVLTIRDVLD
jgi:hypothetical protein